MIENRANVAARVSLVSDEWFTVFAQIWYHVDTMRVSYIYKFRKIPISRSRKRVLTVIILVILLFHFVYVSSKTLSEIHESYKLLVSLASLIQSPVGNARRRQNFAGERFSDKNLIRGISEVADKDKFHAFRDHVALHRQMQIPAGRTYTAGHTEPRHKGRIR